jgi:hypothetical protein
VTLSRYTHHQLYVLGCSNINLANLAYSLFLETLRFIHFHHDGSQHELVLCIVVRGPQATDERTTRKEKTRRDNE